jgi:hypothetical protein
MTDLADKIYNATGLTLNAADTEAIGRMITQGRNDALEEVVVLLEDIAVKTTNGEYEARLPRCVVTISDCLAKIRALKGANQ